MTCCSQKGGSSTDLLLNSTKHDDLLFTTRRHGLSAWVWQGMQLRRYRQAGKPMHWTGCRAQHIRADAVPAVWQLTAFKKRIKTAANLAGGPGKK